MDIATNLSTTRGKFVGWFAMSNINFHMGMSTAVNKRKLRHNDFDKDIQKQVKHLYFHLYFQEMFLMERLIPDHALSRAEYIYIAQAAV